MKKIFNFLRSMRFGIILLILIAACSALGTVIQQGQNMAYYAQSYGSFHGAILLLGLDDIYNSWYFVALLALLCLNLVLCSIVRIKSIVRGDRTAAQTASNTPDTVLLDSEGVEKLVEHLKSAGCKESSFGEARVYSRRSIGRYGTFITHAAILLTVVFGAMALYLPTTTDKSCFPGQSITMDDGSKIFVESFRIEDDEGNLDFTSKIQITNPDGKQSDVNEISVNHPFSFGSLKVYQQTYGTAGSITVRDPETDAEDVFILDDVSFLSIDSINGLWYEAVYPGYLEGDDGNITLITSSSGSYEDPVYQVQLASDGEYTPVLAFPGESVKVGGLEFYFNEPVEYPGLRIKHTPEIVNWLLCGSFLLMIVGLYITFFMPPVLVKTDGKGYAVCGPKAENMRLELKVLLQNYER